MDALREAHAVVRGEVKRTPENDNDRLQPVVGGTQESNADAQYGASPEHLQSGGRPPDHLTRLATARASAVFRGAVVQVTQEDSGRPESAATAEETHAALQKAVSTLRARLALAGWVLAEQGDGTFLASRWGRSRELSDLPAVEAFACMVGAR